MGRGSCHCGGDAEVCSERGEHEIRVQAPQLAPARFYAEHFVGECRGCKRPHLTIDRDAKLCAACRAPRSAAVEAWLRSLGSAA